MLIIIIVYFKLIIYWKKFWIHPNCFMRYTKSFFITSLFVALKIKVIFSTKVRTVLTFNKWSHLYTPKRNSVPRASIDNWISETTNCESVFPRVFLTHESKSCICGNLMEFNLSPCKGWSISVPFHSEDNKLLPVCFGLT